MSSLIQLSIGVTSFAAEDPGTWQPLFDAATVAVSPPPPRSSRVRGRTRLSSMPT
jgi:hypothetical protein